MLRIKIVKKQWERISEVSGNLGLVSFTSVGFPFLFNGIDKSRIILGMVFGGIFCYYSFYIAKKA